MELANIVRKMDKYEFLFDNGKSASVDMRTGEYIGTTGKKIKYVSQSIPNEMRNFFNSPRYTESSGLKEIVDRILSLTDISIEKKLFYVKFFTTSTNNITIENYLTKSEWKILLQVIREMDITSNDSYFYPAREIQKKMNLIKLKPIIEKYKLQEIAEYIMDDNPQFLEVKAFRSAFRHACVNPYEKYQNQVKVMLNCDDEKILRDCCGISFKTYNIKSEVSKLYNTMNQAEYYRTRLNLENYVYTNIERDYKNLETMYKKEKTKIDDAFLAKNQSKYNLNYENEQYKISVPMSRNELATIGGWFHNCANGWEWDTRLSHGDYLIVTIMDKHNTKLVCCDINARTLKIDQYKGKNNSPITDKSLLEFKKEFQNYLYELKGE